MDKHVEGFLDQLATTCATIALRSDDLKKLYTVCLHSHLHGGVPDLQMIKAHLIGKGCSTPTVDFLGRQFEQLTEILKLHDEQNRNAGKQ